VLLNEQLPATNIINPTNNIIAVRDIMDFSTSHNSQFQRTLSDTDTIYTGTTSF